MQATLSTKTEMNLKLKEAKLYNGSSVDREETQTGMDGRRRHWNI